MAKIVEFTPEEAELIDVEHGRFNVEDKLSGPELIRMDTVVAEEVSWLWPGLVPRGKLTMMEGDPGCGKTFLALCLAATVSDGAFMPDHETGKVDRVVDPANVLYMTAEDGIADTIKPRLEAMGAVHQRIYLLEGNRDDKGRLQAVTLENMEPIEEAVEIVKPSLMVIDPIQGYLGGKTDMYRANEVRPLLAALGKLAERYGCAVVCIRHLTKVNSPKAVYRGMGSIDFAAAARSILLVGRDPDDQNKRAVIQTKNSLAPMAEAIGFTLEAGEFHWTGQSDLTVARMFRNEPVEDERTTVDEAKDYLLEALKDGAVEQNIIEADSKELDISYRTLTRAKKALGIKSKRMGKKWGWVLP
jgi:putative DNA primase/helicase